MMPRHKRQKRGDQIFKRWVLPILKDHYPGFWQSTSSTMIDLKHGIDWMYNSPDGPVHFASRSWMSRPYQNHCVRWRKSTNHKIKMETGIMLDNIKKGRLIPDYTIEAWIHDGWVYIAISDSRILWETIRDKIDSLPKMRLKDQIGYTEFLRVPFSLLPQQPRKIVERARGWGL